MDFIRIRLAKEAFKFSSTHFTILSATEAERLHGHNYQVSVECELNSAGPLGMGFEFNELKPHIKSLADAWDERVLIPKRCPWLTSKEEVIRGAAHWSLELKSESFNRSYRFPVEDVVFLETENVTSEELARLFSTSLSRSWQSALSKAGNSELSARVTSLSVTVEETRGQSATYVMQNPLEKR
jgi:6-pyruvoyltetrahydropterin/6-carboxytetrahydropterin synthase